MSPMPNHCIECDKIATITLNEVPYCTKCGLKEQQKPLHKHMKNYFKDRRMA